MILSYSMISSLLDCEQKAYYAHVKNLERKKWKKAFLEGNLFQYGVYRIMIGDSPKKVEKLVLTMLKDFKKDLRKNLSLSPADEQELIAIQSMIVGMLNGYAERYKKDLRIEKHVCNEANMLYDVMKLKGVGIVQFGMQMDNIIEIKGKWYLHEGKAWKYLNNDRMNGLATDLQIGTYFNIHNAFIRDVKVDDRLKKIKLKRFDSVIFDAVQKPSIRQKQGETYRGYLKRVEEYYTGADCNDKFFKEVITPKIQLDDLLHTIKSCALKYHKLQNGATPVKSFKDCSRYDGCDYAPLCFDGGEIKKNLIMYRQSMYQDRYKIKKEA